MPPFSFLSKSFNAPSLKRVFRAFTVEGHVTIRPGIQVSINAEVFLKQKPTYLFTSVQNDYSSGSST